LSEPERIVAEALSLLAGRTQDLRGEHILITVGATREAIDPVRFISNRSSGRMGHALAEAAIERGAEVTLVSGVTSSVPPGKAKIVKVETAEAMATAVQRELADKTIFIASAAVVDYRPTHPANQKIKKKEQTLTLLLEKTSDILSNVAKNRQDGLLVIGFAAETENVLDNAREKLRSKNLDVIVANDVSRSDSGFDTQTNAITILTSNLDTLELPLMSKRDAADRILDTLVDLRKSQRSKHVTG
jgi:phosphopantothenoylcysteine decarboxylase/phosphopantothenate--cysteine ligase